MQDRSNYRHVSITSGFLDQGGIAGLVVALDAGALILGVLLYLLRQSGRKQLIQPDWIRTLEGLQYGNRRCREREHGLRWMPKGAGFGWRCISLEKQN